MDVKKYLAGEIRKCRRRMNLAKLLDRGVLAAAVGGIFGIFCELASLVREFYRVHLAAGLCFGIGLLAGMGYAVYRRADMAQAARRLDSFGLKERIATAYERMDAEDEFAQMQRQDAAECYDRMRGQIKIPLLPDKRHVCALLLAAVAAVGLGFVPSPVREQARLRHQVQEHADEEREGLEELMEALEGVDLGSLTEEQKAQLQALQEAMELSKEELAGADSWGSLAAATQRLDYKYTQAAQGLAGLAAMLDGADAANAEALAKALELAKELANAAADGGKQLASGGTPSAGSGDSGGDGSDGDGGGNSGGNSSGGDSGNGGDKTGNGGDGSSGSGNGSGGNGSESGSGSGNGNGDGGSGGGNGSGDGGGNGGGSGSGTGSGPGRGTGSSDAAHDYVSVPNKVGEDSALTGNKAGDRDSDYFRQQNGLAWEGNHVDYNSVIGEYTDNAYEGIAGGRYPSGMESVIRDYFESLNK